MQWFSQLAEPIRLTVVAVVALLLGGPLVTWAISSLSYFGHRVSPWSDPDLESAGTGEPVSDPNWFAYVPVFGWLSRGDWRREWPRYLAIRGMLLEIAVPLAVTALYYWEVHGGLLPAQAGDPSLPPAAVSLAEVHWQFVGHAVMLLLLIAATFIDWDEMMIPDAITVPGTLFTLGAAAAIPQWRLWVDLAEDQRWPSQLHAATPGGLPLWSERWLGLIVAIAIFWLWCFALADRRVILRRGWRKGLRYFVAGLTRRATWKALVAMAALGGAAIAAGFALLPAEAWRSLFSSLCGLAIGGSIVWMVRIIASLALRMEALGFGDVTLMAMVGAFLGWQPVAIAFFIAPFFALAIVIAIAVTTGQMATPFGPYLAVGTLFVLVRWDSMWNDWLQDVFGVGWPIFAIVAGMFVLMGAMLGIWRLIKMRFVA